MSIAKRALRGTPREILGTLGGISATTSSQTSTELHKKHLGQFQNSSYGSGSSIWNTGKNSQMKILDEFHAMFENQLEEESSERYSWNNCRKNPWSYFL